MNVNMDREIQLLDFLKDDFEERLEDIRTNVFRDVATKNPSLAEDDQRFEDLAAELLEAPLRELAGESLARAISAPPADSFNYRNLALAVTRRMSFAK